MNLVKFHLKCDSVSDSYEYYHWFDIFSHFEPGKKKIMNMTSDLRKKMYICRMSHGR